MKIFLRILRYCLWTLLAVVVAGGALGGYFLYTPAPEIPRLSGTLDKASIEVGGFKRAYRTYVPAKLASGAPLLLVMHGSGEGGAQIRVQTGYAFERLADVHGFVVVYPDAYAFDWNDCSKVGDYSVNGQAVDDVGFLGALTDKLIADLHVDRSRVFAVGVSAGGSMAMRLALEAPSRYRAVAAVAANVPTPDNFKCKPAGQGTSVMIMNGTRDPLVPFAGGEVNLLGLFYKGGTVRSSGESGVYFAAVNKLAGTPAVERKPVADGVSVERALWRNDGKVQVELVAIHGGGHGMPQPYYRNLRLLGPSPAEPNGPAMIWDFFARQQP
ncbi:MAG: PHB depolymerase family esterase [Pseudomonadota bacterium]